MSSLNENNVVQCQKVIRGFLSRKNNLYLKLKKTKDRFVKTVHGYHLINKNAIKEAVWEEINCDVVEKVCKVSDEANGNHLSGKDNKFDNFNISNKTAKTDGNNISISSYRLTSVCSNKSTGEAKDIIKEIERRDSSFDYYSILVRNEMNNKIEYDWYMIPKDYYLFKVKTLVPLLGKKGKKKDEMVGWKSDYCDITFSMSSQLWYKFNIKDIVQFKICSTGVDNKKSKINYAHIFDSFNNQVA